MTTLFVATTGGHLTQLVLLAERMPDADDAVWVTHENAQSTSMLAGRDVRFIPYVGSRDLGGVARSVPVARQLLKSRRIGRAVSTGSGVALAFLPYLAVRGVECHYIESAARVDGPSITGRLLRRAPGVRTHTQYPDRADSTWRYVGNVFDAFEPEAATWSPGETLRVVVTLGTAQEYPFRRLLESLAPLLEPRGDLERATGLPVEVLWQTGPTPSDDLGIQTTPFLAAAELAQHLRDADIVVSHAGTGSALANVAAGHYALVVNRSGRHGETVDDHQVELARFLAGRGLALHREADEVTVDDLLTCLRTRIRKRPVAPLALEGTSAVRPSVAPA